MNQFHYQFTRQIYDRHWTVTVNTNADGTLEIEWHVGPYARGRHSCVWEGYGQLWSGYRASRVSVLRFIACGFRNLRGFCIATAGNAPATPRTIHPHKFHSSRKP